MKSESIAALMTALSAAQGELEDAVKSSVNPHFKSRYADLAEILQAVRPALSKHGLAVSQLIGAYNIEARTVIVVTLLGHKSGEWLMSEIVMPVAKSDPQGIGSAVTYARRYALAAIAGISQDDDDGNEASRNDRHAPADSTWRGEPIINDRQGTSGPNILDAIDMATSVAELESLVPQLTKLEPGPKARARLAYGERKKALSTVNGTEVRS